MTTPTPLLQIGSVSATQLIGNNRLPLCTGILTLLPPPTPSCRLLLTVGATLALPLDHASTVGTSTAKPHAYLFTCILPSLSALEPPNSAAAIEITIPPGEENDALALKLEEVLVENGYLMTGLEADVEDVAGALRDTATGVVETVKGYAQGRVERREEVEPKEEREFSDTTKKVVSGTVEGTGKTAEVTRKVGRAISGAAESVGEWVGGMMHEKKGGEDGIVRKSAEGAAEGVTVVAEGVTDRLVRSTSEQVQAVLTVNSVTRVSSAVGKGTSTVVEHKHGQEAKELVDQGREATRNVGAVAVDVVTGPSVVWNAGEAGIAAARGKNAC